MKNHHLINENELLKQRLVQLETQLSEQNAVLKNKEKVISDKEQIIVEREQTIETKSDKITTLEEYIRAMNIARFGSSSEKTADLQLGLFDEAELLNDLEDESEDTTIVPAHTRKKKRISIPEHLPSVDVIHDLPEHEKVCPHDGTPLRHFGDECSKQLDYQPAKLSVINHVRLKYQCPCCNKYMVTAKKPVQPIEKSIASPNLLAQIATQKYCDALPLYRQGQIFKRLGVELDSTSLANWMIKCGQLIQPLINLFYDTLRERDLLFMDETVLQVLKEKERTPQQQSRMWVMADNHTEGRIVLFHYSATRKADVALTMLGDFNGALMTDGYGVYDNVAKQNDLAHLGCWAHARRYFKEASDVQPKGKTGKPEQALAYIQKLFKIERELKGATTQEKYQHRQAEAIPILNSFKKWCDKSLLYPVKSEKLKKALIYLSNQWPKLIRYTENGAWPIDNNLAENTIRPLVVGRKNWLFAATVDGANASANLYSLVETARANEIEPSYYLKMIFTLLPQATCVENIEALLPWNINKVVG